jgi:hypothetical protein
MKRTGFVFGVVSALAACAAEPRHPLCYGDGSPACGNVGQTGRPAPQPRTVVAAPPVVVRMSEERKVSPISRPLLRMSNDRREAARPLMREEEPATGNVMGKGKPRHHRQEQPNLEADLRASELE